MKVLIFLCLLICMQSPLFAQFKPIAESTEFEEPDEGFTRVLQLKNGYTTRQAGEFIGNAKRISIMVHDYYQNNKASLTNKRKITHNSGRILNIQL